MRAEFERREKATEERLREESNHRKKDLEVLEIRRADDKIYRQRELADLEARLND